MSSLKTEYLENLTFTAEQISTLRSSHLTPNAMEQLTQNYSSATQEKKHDALILVPLAILDFLCVHPFGDGNGRMSRLLTLLLLYGYGLESTMKANRVKPITGEVTDTLVFARTNLINLPEL